MASERGRWSFGRWARRGSEGGVPNERPQRPPAPAAAQPTPSAHGPEQRRFPRVRVVSSLYGYSVELDLSVTIRDVSLGGFAIESPIPFPVGAEQTFLITTSDSQETLVRCVCRHARKTTSAQGAAACIAGFEFLPQADDNLKLIADTVSRLIKTMADSGTK
jgi:hypothetical protein